MRVNEDEEQCSASMLMQIFLPMSLTVQPRTPIEYLNPQGHLPAVSSRLCARSYLLLADMKVTESLFDRIPQVSEF